MPDAQVAALDGGIQAVGAGSGAAAFDELVFQRELNEVYLLLDFISGRPDRHLSDLEGKIDDPDHAGATLSAGAIIERVSLIRFPPGPSPIKRGQDAAFLLSLKDALNSLAYPARGLTVAYTALFSELGKSAGSRDEKKPASRTWAAQLAFPSLVKGAVRFRAFKNVLATFGLIVTILSSIFLWEATYGIQLTARFDEAKSNDTQSAAKLYEQIDNDATLKGGSIRDLTVFCRIDGSAPVSSAIQQSCNDYAYHHALFAVTITDISRYGQSLLFQISAALLPMHGIQPPGQQEDAQSVAGVLAMMSNYLLPILFGLIGTITALVRGIQDKVTESVLSPRDQALALIRLPLGVVAGVCVGLFLNPTSVETQSAGGIGAFTISASGIAFLAGYGAEAFFRALDTLIVRVFSLPAPAAGGRTP